MKEGVEVTILKFGDKILDVAVPNTMCVCVRVCVHACVRACVRACAWARERVGARVKDGVILALLILALLVPQPRGCWCTCPAYLTYLPSLPHPPHLPNLPDLMGSTGTAGRWR